MRNPKQLDKKVLVLSAALTTLVLAAVTAGLMVLNPPSQRAQADVVPASADSQPPLVVTVEPILISPQVSSQGATATQAPASSASPAPQATDQDALIQAYQARLEEAYRALQEAYAQIEALQAAQAQSGSANAFYYDDDYDEEHEEHHEGYHEEHEEHHEKHEEHED